MKNSYFYCGIVGVQWLKFSIIASKAYISTLYFVNLFCYDVKKEYEASFLLLSFKGPIGVRYWCYSNTNAYNSVVHVSSMRGAFLFLRENISILNEQQIESALRPLCNFSRFLLFTYSSCAANWILCQSYLKEKDLWFCSYIILI